MLSGYAGLIPSAGPEIAFLREVTFFSKKSGQLSCIASETLAQELLQSGSTGTCFQKLTRCQIHTGKGVQYVGLPEQGR